MLEEAMYAKSNNILVPLLLDKVHPPFGFSLIQAADLTAWNNDAANPYFRECIEGSELNTCTAGVSAFA